MLVWFDLKRQDRIVNDLDDLTHATGTDDSANKVKLSSVEGRRQNGKTKQNATYVQLVDTEAPRRVNWEAALTCKNQRALCQEDMFAGQAQANP